MQFRVNPFKGQRPVHSTARTKEQMGKQSGNNETTINKRK